MIYIVDGPDGAGKDLLCSILQKSTGYEVKHLSHDNYERPFNRDLYLSLLDTDNVIYNRFHFSEIVYARVKNRLSDIDSNDVAAIEDVIKQKNVVVIYVTNALSILAKRTKSRGETFVNAYELKIALQSYEFVMNKDFISKITMNLPEAVINAL